MKLITRSGCKRLAVLGVLLGLFLLWAWFAMIRMPLKSYRGALPPLTAQQNALRESLERDVQALAVGIGQRSFFQPKKLRAAAAFVEASFTNAGFKVTSQDYQLMAETCRNLEIESPGK